LTCHTTESTSVQCSDVRLDIYRLIKAFKSPTYDPSTHKDHHELESAPRKHLKTQDNTSASSNRGIIYPYVLYTAKEISTGDGALVAINDAVPDTPITNTTACQTPATLNNTVVCDMTQFVNNDIDGFTGVIKSRYGRHV